MFTLLIATSNFIEGKTEMSFPIVIPLIVCFNIRNLIENKVRWKRRKEEKREKKMNEPNLNITVVSHKERIGQHLLLIPSPCSNLFVSLLLCCRCSHNRIDHVIKAEEIDWDTKKKKKWIQIIRDWNETKKKKIPASLSLFATDKREEVEEEEREDDAVEEGGGRGECGSKWMMAEKWRSVVTSLPMCQNSVAERRREWVMRRERRWKKGEEREYTGWCGRSGGGGGVSNRRNAFNIHNDSPIKKRECNLKGKE